MVTSVHLLVGAALGVIFKQPAIVIPVAFSTHYLLDAIPHYAPKPVKGFKETGLRGSSIVEIVAKGAEPLIGIVLIAVLTASAPSNLKMPLVIGALFGWLPDFFVFLEWKYKIKRPWPFRDFEIRTHKHIGGLRGVLPQVFVALGCLIFCISRVR